METYIVNLIPALLGVLSCQSSMAQEDPLLGGSFTTQLNTAYIGKIGTVFDHNPTTVNYLDINLGSDWTAELWSSTNLAGDRYNTTYGDELDLFLTWHRSFNDVRVSLTGAYFFLKDIGSLDDDIWIGEAEVSYTKWPCFRPYLCTRYFGEVSSKSAENGWFGWVGIRGTYPTGIRQVDLTLDISAACSDGALGRPPGLVYGRAVVGLPIKIGKRVTLTPSILLQTPLGEQQDNPLPYTDREEAVGSLTLNFAF